MRIRLAAALVLGTLLALPSPLTISARHHPSDRIQELLEDAPERMFVADLRPVGASPRPGETPGPLDRASFKLMGRTYEDKGTKTLASLSVTGVSARSAHAWAVLIDAGDDCEETNGTFEYYVSTKETDLRAYSSNVATMTTLLTRPKGEPLPDFEGWANWKVAVYARGSDDPNHRGNVIACGALHPQMGVAELPNGDCPTESRRMGEAILRRFSDSKNTLFTLRVERLAPHGVYAWRIHAVTATPDGCTQDPPGEIIVQSNQGQELRANAKGDAVMTTMLPTLLPPSQGGYAVCVYERRVSAPGGIGDRLACGDVYGSFSRHWW